MVALRAVISSPKANAPEEPVVRLSVLSALVAKCLITIFFPLTAFVGARIVLLPVVAMENMFPSEASSATVAPSVRVTTAKPGAPKSIELIS